MTAPLQPGGAATPTELAEAQQMLAARAREVDVVRAAAAKWQAGLAGLLGLVTGSSVLTVGKTIPDLKQGWGILTAVVLAGSVAIAVWSIYSALRASGGTPKLRLTRGADVDYTTHVEARVAAADLRSAMTGAIGSLVLFAVAVGLTWFAPQPSTPEPVLFVNDGTVEVCGTLEVVIGDTLFLQEGINQSRSFPVGSIESLRTGESCPGS